MYKRQALEEVEGQGGHLEPIEEEGPTARDPLDRFDIPVDTSTGVAPLRPERHGRRWLVGAALVVAVLALAGVVGMQQGWLPRVLSRVSSVSGR